ncbi:MAG: hypothetical protein FJX57_17265 [Alphaproteobacteria bacterium]|nr:hypothetical protein [Alphaproteobacteria bacterium]
MDRDVADDDVGLEDQREHVIVNAAGLVDLRRGAALEIAASKRRLDQLTVDRLEIELDLVRIFLLSEAPDDEVAHVSLTPLIVRQVDRPSRIRRRRTR